MASAADDKEATANVEIPSTPQPRHATIPSDVLDDNSRIESMTTSSPSPEPTQIVDQTKYTSPAPHSSSMTPPPSSQMPDQWPSPQHRPSTPSQALLTSPPLTTFNAIKRESSSATHSLLPSSQQIAEASAPELRQMLQAALLENSKLEANVAELRMSAAHYKLQHQLLGIETEEDKSRMEVEHDMTRREVEVLRMAEHAREARGSQTPVQSGSNQYIAELKAYCEAMDSEMRLLLRRLEKAKDIISDRDERLEAALDENRSLIRRIRENREHFNRMKSPGGIYASATPHQPESRFPVTPQQYRATPQRTPRLHQQGHEDSQDSFAALLLADRVLQQENSSAPTTPTTSAHTHPHHRHLHQHNRNVQSLSSLPTTPVRSRPMTSDGHLLPSVQFAPQSEPRYRSNAPYYQERSRKSRDSTISADDANEMNEYNRAAREEELADSQASQNAAAMLRRDARQSFEVLNNSAPIRAPEKGGFLQTKLFGNVTKPGVEKRKRGDDTEANTGKRTRVEGVGLGIEGW